MRSHDGWVVRFLHFRATATFGVCTGFERCFGYNEFRTTSRILTAVDLAFGHEQNLWVGEAEYSGSISDYLNTQFPVRNSTDENVLR